VLTFFPYSGPEEEAGNRLHSLLRRHQEAHHGGESRSEFNPHIALFSFMVESQCCQMALIREATFGYFSYAN
jgi:hypothetical protein